MANSRTLSRSTGTVAHSVRMMSPCAALTFWFLSSLTCWFLILRII